MPPSEDSPEPSDIHQTLRLGSSSEDDGFQLDQTIDSQLYATIKNGTANVKHLKVLIPGFEILEELGRGAFGVVYRARDVKLDRHVAIKVSLLDDPSRREQYIREARNAAKLETVGIVPVFQVGTLRDGQPFVVQRLIDGCSLRQLVIEAGGVDVRRACILMKDIAEAVAHAHAVGMIHRDLKPDNILIDAAGKPWVADFGLAILEEDQKQHRGERAGTPLYMSPEQLRGRTEWLDGRTDIYALGIMLYEMLTGRPPFDAQSLAELEEQVLHRDPKPITQRVPHIPAAMDVIFQNCCAKQVNERYANAHELVADLQAVLSEMTQVDSQVSPLGLPAGQFESSRRPSTPLPVSVRRKTLRQAEPVRTTLLQKDRKSYLRQYGLAISLVSVTLVGLVAFMLWPPRPVPSPSESEKSSSTVSGILDAGTLATEQNPELEGSLPESELTQPVSTIPDRPFRVSKGSDGTHNTIQAAIADAEEGETITILPGNYVETLALHRSVNLVGEGLREDVVIVGQNENAVSLSGNISVTLRSLTLDGHKSGDKDLNTIDVQGGTLTLDDCEVNTRSYDCVKLQPGSGLVATNCRFRATSHPAIRADGTRELSISGCFFDIHPPRLDDSIIPIGVQASNCKGTISGCSFVGSGAAIGIHWDATQQPVTIEDSTFEDCEFGIVVQACSQVTIAGKERIVLNGCRNGLFLERSTAKISGIDIDSALGELGIRVVDSEEVTVAPRVTIGDCAIRGYDVSLSIERASVRVDSLHCSNSGQTGVQVAAQGRLRMQTSVISDTELMGLYIEDATAVLSDCQLIKNKGAGIWVDSYANALATRDCTFRDNVSGVLIASGSIKLEGGGFHSNSLGILVTSHEQLGQKKGGTPTDIFVDLERVEFTDNMNGWMKISTPCSYRLVADDINQGGGPATPIIIGDLKARPAGDITQVKPPASGGKPL